MRNQSGDVLACSSATQHRLTTLLSSAAGERGQRSGWVAAHRGCARSGKLKPEEAGRVSRALEPACRRAGGPASLTFGLSWLGKGLG